MLLHLFGYKKSIEDKHKLVINEEQAKVVKKIYEEYSIDPDSENVQDFIDAIEEGLGVTLEEV